MPINLDPVHSGYNLSVINDNFEEIKNKWDTKLDRLSSVKPNQMEQELDMNSNRILNVGAPADPLDVVRLKDLEALVIDADVVGVIPLDQPRQQGDGTTKQFAAPNDKDVSPVTMNVRIDGVQQRAFTDYDVTAPHVITFSEAPPKNSDIDITYFEPNVVENPDVSLRTVKSTGSSETRTLADRFADTSNVKDFGAVGNGTTDDTLAIQAAVDAAAAKGDGAGVYLPYGQYLISDTIRINNPISFIGESSETTILVDDAFTGTAIRVQSSKSPRIENLWIRHQTLDAGRTKRNGIGIDFFGDIAGGSSLQVHANNIKVWGFNIGSQYSGTFNSSFNNLTMKACDISYFLRNDTNDSMVFTACRSNLAIGQHIIADPTATGIGLDSSGGTFIGCEFENSDTFPYIDVRSGTYGCFFNFYGCYTYENNTGTNISDYAAIRSLVAGKWHFDSTPIRSSLLADARLFLGRRGSSLLNWDIRIEGAEMKSGRASPASYTGDIDIDGFGSDAADSCYISPSCVYENHADPDYGLFAAGTQMTLHKSDYTTGDQYMWYVNPTRMRFQGMPSGVDFRLWDNAFLGVNTNGGNSYNTGAFLFRNGVQNNYLWVSTDGKLRIKTGSAPAFDSDGTVVGAQS